MMKIAYALLFLAGFVINPAFAEETPTENTVNFEEYHDFAANLDVRDYGINLADFLERRRDENTLVLDMRPRGSYDYSHIEGAVHLGPDITLARLQKIIPNTETEILIYCEYSLFPTRMIALTHIGLPQIIMHGYENVSMLEPIWAEEGAIITDPSSLVPMTRGE